MTHLAKTPDGLLPCPFCGGEVDVHYFAHDDSECTVMCSNPNCRASVSARSCGSMTTAYNRARKLWNRREGRTCRMDYDQVHCDYICTSCGERYETDMYISISGDDRRFIKQKRYCPNCGARVEDE